MLVFKLPKLFLECLRGRLLWWRDFRFVELCLVVRGLHPALVLAVRGPDTQNAYHRVWVEKFYGPDDACRYLVRLRLALTKSRGNLKKKEGLPA